MGLCNNGIINLRMAWLVGGFNPTLGDMMGIVGIEIEYHLVGGFNPTPLKNDGVKVSWDDELFPIYGKS